LSTIWPNIFTSHSSIFKHIRTSAQDHHGDVHKACDQFWRCHSHCSSTFSSSVISSHLKPLSKFTLHTMLMPFFGHPG
jgi:hypothetical protein